LVTPFRQGRQTPSSAKPSSQNLVTLAGERIRILARSCGSNGLDQKVSPFTRAKSVNAKGISLGIHAALLVELSPYGIFVEAIDLVVQVGWLDGRRQMLGVWEIERRLQENQVRFRQLYRPGDAAMQPMQRR